MIICPKCSAENEDTELRCTSCDEWLLFYEFKNSEKKKDIGKKPKIAEKKVFLPDKLTAKEKEFKLSEKTEKILLLGDTSVQQETTTLKDAIVQMAFSPECPNCGGEVKLYEVRCRHCNTILQDKIEQSKKLKPVWEKIFRDKILQDGKYTDIYTDGDIKFIFKKMFDKSNKLVLYMIFILLFLVLAGILLLYCAGTISTKLP